MGNVNECPVTFLRPLNDNFFYENMYNQCIENRNI